MRMATGVQVGPEKHLGSAIQGAHGAQMLHRQSLQADHKFCDVARRVRDVIKVPIEDHRTFLRKNNLMFAIVAVTGARGTSGERIRASPQSFEQSLRLDSPSRV